MATGSTKPKMRRVASRAGRNDDSRDCVDTQSTSSGDDNDGDTSSTGQPARRARKCAQVLNPDTRPADSTTDRYLMDRATGRYRVDRGVIRQLASRCVNTNNPDQSVVSSVPAPANSVDIGMLVSGIFNAVHTSAPQIRMGHQTIGRSIQVPSAVRSDAASASASQGYVPTGQRVQPGVLAFDAVRPDAAGASVSQGHLTTGRRVNADSPAIAKLRMDVVLCQTRVSRAEANLTHARQSLSTAQRALDAGLSGASVPTGVLDGPPKYEDIFPGR